MLRKKPAGKLLARAHQIDREFRILKALEKTAVPVPQTYAFCADESVIGQSFYVCEFLEGRVLKDFASVPISERAAIQLELARVLAALHQVDIKAVGLEDYGPEGNYYRRQLKVWNEQWSKSKVEPVPSMEALFEILSASMVEQRRMTIVHGDYRLENVMFHPTQPRIIGVLDWELSTIGDPRADIAYCCLGYHFNVGSNNTDLRGKKRTKKRKKDMSYFFSKVSQVKPSLFLAIVH